MALTAHRAVIHSRRLHFVYPGRSYLPPAADGLSGGQSLHWVYEALKLTCHCEERSDVAIPQNLLPGRRWPSASEVGSGLREEMLDEGGV